MLDFKSFCKKFSEKEESEITSIYESETKENNVSPELMNIIREEIRINQRESTKLGNYVEDYFYLKLKKFLKARDDFRGNYSIIGHIQQLKDSVLQYIKENAKNDDEISNKIKISGINLIQRAEEVFKTKSKKIQIDSFFPGISGKIVKAFFNEINEFSYSSKDFSSSIDDSKNYNLIVESTHCITSQINKKRKQLEKYFMVFSKTKKLYNENKEILKEFYINFLKNFKIIKNEINISHEELLNKSNFIYIICSNKNYLNTKLFQESMYDRTKFEELVNKLSLLQNSQKDNNNLKKGDKKIKKINNKKNAQEKYEAKVNSKNKEGKNNIKDEVPKQKENDNKAKEQKKVENTIKDEVSKERENNSKDVEIKEKEADNNIQFDSDENEEYDPEKYINEFRNVLNKIEEEKEKFLIIYLDSYDKLFVPVSVIKDGFNVLNEKYDILTEKYEALKKNYEETNKLINTIKELHPEFFKK